MTNKTRKQNRTTEAIDARLDACVHCRHRNADRCELAGQSLSEMARDPGTDCPRRLWPHAPAPTRPFSPAKPQADTRQCATPEVVTCDVVIPYHPATLGFVQEAINSILNQNHVKPIIHCIADGVPDGHNHVPVMYADIPEIRCYAIDVATGPYVATNRVFSHFETDYIAIQDSDDIAMPNRIVESIEAMRSAGLDMIGGKMEQFVDHRSTVPRLTERLMKQPICSSGVTSIYAPSGNIINCTMTVRRDAFLRLNGFADWFCSCDSHFVERGHRAGLKISALQIILGLRRLQDGSISNCGPLGMGTPRRTAELNHILDDYKLMDDGVDPAVLGSLNLFHDKQLERIN